MRMVVNALALAALSIAAWAQTALADIPPPKPTSPSAPVPLGDVLPDPGQAGLVLGLVALPIIVVGVLIGLGIVFLVNRRRGT